MTLSKIKRALESFGYNIEKDVLTSLIWKDIAKDTHERIEINSTTKNIKKYNIFDSKSCGGKTEISFTDEEQIVINQLRILLGWEA